MKLRHLASLSVHGIATLLGRRARPILGTIILTDACNLACEHCAVSNLARRSAPYAEVRAEMLAMYRDGIRILFFCGGETFLWRDGAKDVRALVREAKALGFYLVNVVTNGTIDLRLPEASVVFLSLDGDREAHDRIRGPTYDRILRNLDAARDTNVCLYTAVNRLNRHAIRAVAALAREHPNVRSVSFNFHTPYDGTRHLALSEEEKREAVGAIRGLMDEGYPVFNLRNTLDAFLRNDWPRPSRQCVVWEDGKRFVCGRCVELPGLCEQCGYLFAVEFGLLFSGHPRTILEALRTYPRYA